MASLAAALLCLCAPACARADWPLSARALTASAAPHALPLRLRLRPRAQPRCETAVGARGAAALSIGVQGLLPRAPWWWKRHRERAFGALWQTFSRQKRQISAAARAQPSRAWSSVVVYQWSSICQGLCRDTSAIYRPCSMPVRTHKTGVHLATTGTQGQS